MKSTTLNLFDFPKVLKIFKIMIQFQLIWSIHIAHKNIINTMKKSILIIKESKQIISKWFTRKFDSSFSITNQKLDTNFKFSCLTNESLLYED